MFQNRFVGPSRPSKRPPGIKVGRAFSNISNNELSFRLGSGQSFGTTGETGGRGKQPNTTSQAHNTVCLFRGEEVIVPKTPFRAPPPSWPFSGLSQIHEIHRKLMRSRKARKVSSPDVQVEHVGARVVDVAAKKKRSSSFKNDFETVKKMLLCTTVLLQ